MKMILRLLIQASRYVLRGFKRKSSPSLFLEKPSRTFNIPEMTSIERAHFILKSMNYEIVEQCLSQDEFTLVALKDNLDQKPNNSQHFKRVLISLLGKRINGRWEVQVSFATEDPLIIPDVKYADLILEDLTRALRWQSYWIIECPPPEETAA